MNLGKLTAPLQEKIAGLGELVQEMVDNQEKQLDIQRDILVELKAINEHKK